MRALVQRVSEARVRVDGEVIGAIGTGFLVFVGVGAGDTPDDMAYLARKVADLRVFEDPDGRMNLALADVRGAVLAVSQFTLYGDTRKGRRPSFVGAMEPGAASAMFDQLVDAWRAAGLHVETGRFGADMKVELINDGPVTLWIDTAAR